MSKIKLFPWLFSGGDFFFLSCKMSAFSLSLHSVVPTFAEEGRGGEQAPWCLLMVLILMWGLYIISSKPDYLPNAWSPNTFTLQVRASIKVWIWGEHIYFSFSIANMKVDVPVSWYPLGQPLAREWVVSELEVSLPLSYVRTKQWGMIYTLRE